MDLKGKLSLVTGSTSGIGLSIAHILAKAGSDIIITGFGDEKTIKDIVETIKDKYNVKAEYIGADLLKVSETKDLVSQTLKNHPEGIDILVNNAGKTEYHNIDKLPDEDWDAAIALDLTAPFHLIKGFLPGMKKKKWGRIVNIASSLSHAAVPTMTAYCTAKHGVLGLTKGVALENAQYGITCNAVCPGPTETPMKQRSMEIYAKRYGTTVEEEKAKMLMYIPTGKIVLPEQVAELALFLVASGASNQMTGASYLIDGGSIAM